MAFTFVADDFGRSKIALVEDSDFIVPLVIAPPCLEDFLKQGKWFIVSMSVWSVHDIVAGRRAVELIKRYEGSIRLGLRPFDYPHENFSWIPDLNVGQIADHIKVSATEADGILNVAIQGRANASPVWVAIIDGKVVDVRFGQLPDSEIEAMVAQLISTSEGVKS